MLKTGSLLFVNGGSAVQPVQHFAGTSIGFAGETAYIEMLHQALKDEPIYVGQLIIPGAIIPGDAQKDPEVLAERLWQMHAERRELGKQAAEHLVRTPLSDAPEWEIRLATCPDPSPSARAFASMFVPQAALGELHADLAMQQG